MSSAEKRVFVTKEDFEEKVILKIQEVPKGRVTTYGDVAAALGARKMARHVGWALKQCVEEEDLPWWRVVNSRGEVSFRPDDAIVPGTKRKREKSGANVPEEDAATPLSSGSDQEDRLRAEGITFSLRSGLGGRRIENFSSFLHNFDV